MTPTRTPLRVGVVGAAYASGAHLPVYTALAAEGVVELVAVATARRETAEAAARGSGAARAHVGFEALCADPDVDLVDVATRPSRHRAMAEAALAAGKHVLSEAPLAATTAEGESMVAAADRAGRLGLVDLQSRFWPGVLELRRLVREGWIGHVENVAATAFHPTFTAPAAVRASGWCAEAEHGASSLRVHGLHTVDLLRFVLGELTDVRGSVATRRPDWPGPDGPLPATSVDSAAFTARIGPGPGEGAVCSVHTSWVARFGAGFRLVVHGSDGVLVASAAGHTGHFPVRLEGARAGEPGLRELVPGDGERTAPFTELVRRLAARVAGAAEPDLPDFADGLAALRVADAVEHPIPPTAPGGVA
jgi:predicted dehydrogenase